MFEGEDIEAQARVAFFAFTPCEGIAYLDDPDLNLMIDAPDLLAEVKRLRSITDDLYAYIVSDADISLSIIEEQMDWREEE